jgi:putative membrane protein
VTDAFSGIYCGPPPEPGALWTSWNLDPLVLAALAVMALTVGRNRPGAAAVGTLLVVFVSPLCALSSALFAARTVHHILLVAVAAPLLAAALPRLRTGAPALHLALSTASLWLWHLPAAYDLALSNMAVYWAMQATLFVPALFFWRAVMAADVPATTGVLLVTGAYTQMALLGALITFAPVPLYALHQTAPLAWGLVPLADQQLAGLIMWVPGGLPYAIAGAIVARRAWTRQLGGARA